MRTARSAASKPFASFFGADFYGVPRNAATVTLLREPWTVPTTYAFGDDALVPLRAGDTVAWHVAPQPRTWIKRRTCIAAPTAIIAS